MHQIGALPPVWPDDPLDSVREHNKGTSVIVLDDDPTGTQTVSNVHITTRWDQNTVADLVNRRGHASFILTNSRSRDPGTAATIAATIGQRIRAAIDDQNPQVSLISRSDSTLRGHFPVEVDALLRGLEWDDAKILIAPFLEGANRVTIHGTHYVRAGDRLTPVSETEFARDPIFGYRSARLSEWLLERGVNDRPVAQIELELIRTGGPEAVYDRLVGLPVRSIVIIDSLEGRDIDVVAAGAAMAEHEGVRVLPRTAACYARARSGQPIHPLLTREQLGVSGPGIVVFGSHTDISSRQLEVLLEDRTVDPHAIEVPVGHVLPESDHRWMTAAARQVDEDLKAGRTPIVFTDRTSRDTGSADDGRAVARRFSKALVEIIRKVRRTPGWIVAKGGITSSDIATDALAVGTALVRGQVAPGVPLWILGSESRFPGLPYVVFPGNVGTQLDVRQIVRLLRN
jgi:uncharacterized protein YgbK (DUF1537 family)